MRIYLKTKIGCNVLRWDVAMWYSFFMKMRSKRGHYRLGFQWWYHEIYDSPKSPFLFTWVVPYSIAILASSMTCETFIYYNLMFVQIHCLASCHFEGIYIYLDSLFSFFAAKNYVIGYHYTIFVSYKKS